MPDAIALTRWLEDMDLCRAAVEVLVAGQRVTQETVGLERLTELDPWW